MPTEEHTADDRMNCDDNSAGAASNHDAMDAIAGELLVTKPSKEKTKEQLQTKTTQPRRRGSFLEDFNLEDFDDLDDEDDQYVDIEQDAQHGPPPSSFDLSSPPRQIRRIAGEANRPNVTCASSPANDDTRAVDSAESCHHQPNRCHSLMNLNDVPTVDNDNGGRLPRRISFECHSSALLEGMVAGGEFADVFHSDSDSDSDTCSTASSDLDSGMSQQRRRRPSAPSSPALARLGGSGAANGGSTIRRAASTIGLRSSSSMISLASICEDANVREAPSLISKVDRYVINREIRLGSSIVRTQSELAMAQVAQQQQEEDEVGPHTNTGTSTTDAVTVSTTFTRRGRRRSNRSYASTNDLSSASIVA